MRVYLVQTREQWDADEPYRTMAQEYGMPPSLHSWPPAEEVIQRNVKWLLEHLYTPDIEVGCHRERIWAKLPFGEQVSFRHESINWGDLGVTGCEKRGDHWHIILEEAATDSCNLCRYVAEWMAVWGWPCDVVAEW